MHRRAALLFWGLALSGSAFGGDLYVIVNAGSGVQTLPQHDVVALFTGRLRTLPGGAMATVYDHPGDSSARADFYQRITGMDLARINSYWARLLFTGRGQPPRPLADDAAVIARVGADRAAVGYVSTRPSDAAVHIAFVLPASN